MHPVLLKIGPVTIHSYGFMMALGVLSAILLSLKLASKHNIDKKQLSDFFFYTILLGLLGAKLFLLATDAGYYFEKPARMKELIFSGGTFYGGLIFGALYATWFIRRHKWDFRLMGDIVGPSVALAHFFGRMGCFMAGCCWGREAHDCAIAVKFENMNTSTGVPHGVLLYPVQLIESLLNLLNFFVLMLLSRRKTFNGQIFAVYIFNYALIRYSVEFLRGDPDRGYVFGNWEHPFSSLSVPQLISLLGVVLAAILYFNFRKKPTPSASGAAKKK